MRDNLYRIETKPRLGRWRAKYSVAEWGQAVLLYEGVNIGNGYSKRLTINGQTLDRRDSTTM
jgi:hypothetical protein